MLAARSPSATFARAFRGESAQIVNADGERPRPTHQGPSAMTTTETAAAPTPTLDDMILAANEGDGEFGIMPGRPCWVRFTHRDGWAYGFQFHTPSEARGWFRNITM